MENDGHSFVEFDYGVDVAHRYGVERGGGLDGVYDQMVAVDFDGGLNGNFLEQQGYVEFVEIGRASCRERVLRLV